MFPNSKKEKAKLKPFLIEFGELGSNQGLNCDVDSLGHRKSEKCFFAPKDVLIRPSFAFAFGLPTWMGGTAKTFGDYFFLPKLSFFGQTYTHTHIVNASTLASFQNTLPSFIVLRFSFSRAVCCSVWRSNVRTSWFRCISPLSYSWKLSEALFVDVLKIEGFLLQKPHASTYKPITSKIQLQN